MAEDKSVKTFNSGDLKPKQLEDFTFVQKRISSLQEYRLKHYGVNLDLLFTEADRDYVPHRLKGKGKRVIADDESKGWRGSIVELGSSDWQSDISQANPFVKIQTALAILVDQNPSGVFSATSKKYESTTMLMRQLYERSWDYAKSKAQLKLFVYNLAKYGWAIARTYPLRIARKVKVLTKFDQEDPENSEYDDREVVEFNDIFRENLDPRNCWIDDMAKPNNEFTMRDWCWRKVYPMDSFMEEFGKYKRADLVTAGGNTQETINNQKGATGTYGSSGNSQEKKETDLVEVLFYENKLKDLYMVIANGVPVIIEPLPIADSRGQKKLSCWQTYWNLRHSESPYGIGIYEAIRFDQALMDRIRNMTIDQLTMSIYKMFFYQGTQNLTETGDITIKPGVGKQILDPKNISWLQVPGPGAEAWQGLEIFKKDLDEASGITDPLLGQVTGKTAFELAQAKESALKRLKVPLDNILDALNTEGYITVSLIQLLYSIPETYEIADKELIDKYLKETQSDPELFDRTEAGAFQAKVYREFPLNLDKDEKGNLIETAGTEFFRTKPSALNWEGIINIKAQSILSPSKQIDKALDQEMFTQLIPLMQLPPELYKKIATELCKIYDKDPEDILPDSWLQDPQEGQSLIVPQQQIMSQMMGGQGGPQAPQASPTPGPSPIGSMNPQSLVGQVSAKQSAPFRAL